MYELGQCAYVIPVATDLNLVCEVDLLERLGLTLSIETTRVNVDKDCTTSLLDIGLKVLE
jgi:hypothetical protein